MDESHDFTLADVMAEAHVLAENEREAALTWARGLDRDVARAVREAPRARWLGALADGLDQRLVWAGYVLDRDDAVPERVAANAEMRSRGPDHPANVRLAQLNAWARDPDPHVRAEAMRDIAEESRAFMASDLGKAFSAQATPAMLDAEIDRLRSALDVDRMRAALGARVRDETPEQREERVIAETTADQTEILRGPDDMRSAALWGGTGGRAFRVISPAGVRRVIDAGKELRRRMRPPQT